MADQDNLMEESHSSNGVEDNNVDNSQQLFANNDNQQPIATKDGNLLNDIPNDNISKTSGDFHSITASPKELSNLMITDDCTQVAKKDGHLKITSTNDQTPMSVKDDQPLHTGGVKQDFISDAEKSLMTTEHSNAMSTNDPSEITVYEDKLLMSNCGDQSQMDCISDQPLQMIKEDAKLNSCSGVDTLEMNFLPADDQTQRSSQSDFSNAIHSDKKVKELNVNDQHQAVCPEHKVLYEESNGQIDISASNESETQNLILEQENGMVVESISAKCLESDESLQNVDLVVTIKQEPEDSGYEKRELIYRGGAIVVYSDTDSDSDSSFNVLSPAPVEASEEEQEVPTNHDEVIEHQNERNKKSSKCISRTEGEVFPEELPPLEYLTISPDEGVELEPIGTVSGIVDVLVIVKANSNSPALYDDTVLFLEGRRPLGLIFETFGTVERPFYSVRFNNHRDILEQNISVGDRIYFAPKADNLTKYVFISELRKVKFDDASWENDNEPPPAQIEYSDDEEEKRAKQRQKNKSRGSEGGMNGQTNGRKKKRKQTYMEERSESQGPQLLTGDLNRNPFGDRDQMYNPPPSNQWPPKEVRGFPPQQFQAQSNGSFRRPPQAHFGESPDWKSQPNMGRTPTNHNISYMGNSGSFATNNNNWHGMMAPASSFSGSSYPAPPTNTYNSHNYNVPPLIPLPGSNSYFIPANMPQNYNLPRGNYPCFSQFNPSQQPPNIFSQRPPPLPPSSK
ncbi:unnamed protein product [Lymnaea stagnalis]|uniref:H/ACA ribonucleoprotein complex non-core subunit NAF1 n=1 Tax=Lymnaea stagnalis TaxID=6523 RepID=A0AAV2I8X9_LYMST